MDRSADELMRGAGESVRGEMMRRARTSAVAQVGADVAGVHASHLSDEVMDEVEEPQNARQIEVLLRSRRMDVQLGRQSSSEAFWVGSVVSSRTRTRADTKNCCPVTSRAGCPACGTPLAAAIAASAADVSSPLTILTGTVSDLTPGRERRSRDGASKNQQWPPPGASLPSPEERQQTGCRSAKELIARLE